MNKIKRRNKKTNHPAVRAQSAATKKQAAVVPSGATQNEVQVHEEITTSTYTGPLPPPEQLGQYEVILPGVAAKIVSMAETEQKHRMGWETNALDSDIKLAKRGQLFGFCAAVLCIAGATLLGYWGMAWELCPKVVRGVKSRGYLVVELLCLNPVFELYTFYHFPKLPESSQPAPVVLCTNTQLEHHAQHPLSA